MSEATVTAVHTPSEIDEILSGLWIREQDARRHAADYRRWAAKHGHQADTYERSAEEHEALAAEVRAEARPYEAEYTARGGWSRFFVVNNTGGHVHSTMSCSTCFPSTSFSWLPSLSGRTEEEMVAEFGEMACTVCFPSAPTFRGFGDGTSALARYSADEKAERAAEKANRQAAKDAKAITAPDGSPLRVDGDTLRTIVSAERKLSDVVQSFGWYGPSHPSRFQDQALVVMEALLARGIASERIDGIVERAAKKARKEGGEHA